MKRKLTATTPHGTFTRTTARTYTHVVVAFFSDDYMKKVWNRDRAELPAVSWCGRPDLAVKLLGTLSAERIMTDDDNARRDRAIKRNPWNRRATQRNATGPAMYRLVEVFPVDADPAGK